MKNWHRLLILFFVGVVVAFFLCRHFRYNTSEPLQNDSLSIAHTETEKAIAGVDALEKSESIRVPKTDSLINKKYENIPLSFRNFYIDSLQREQLRTIKRLNKRKCPY